MSRPVRKRILACAFLALAASLVMALPTAAKAPPATFASLVAKVAPAVVNIRAVRQMDLTPFQRFRGRSPDLDEYFRRFFGRGMPRRRIPALGSGVIVDPRGFVLTNFHVVARAQEILVKMKDGNEFPGKVVGRDRYTDLALLKIKAGKPLPYLPLGDSSKLNVGDWVIAVGNPYGLSHSVTAGIVSAKGRYIGAGPYDDFIQTDASINPGNSGGPLINMAGQVVGINTLKHASGHGIGFAIPSNMAKRVMEQLKSKGRVVRGWLGIRFQPMNKELAQKFGLKKPRGVLVAEVFPGSPAERAGLKAGDVLVKFNGWEIRKTTALPRLVAGRPVGSKVTVEVIRGGRTLKLEVTLGERKDEELAALPKGRATLAKLGLAVRELTPELAQQLGIQAVGGVLVARVMSGSPATEAGLRAGDVILEAAQKPLDNVAQLSTLVAKLKPGEGLLLFIQRRRGTLFTVLKAPS